MRSNPGISSVSPGSPASTSSSAWWAGSPATGLWLATIRRVPRKRALEGPSKGTDEPFSPPGASGKRSISWPWGETTAICWGSPTIGT